MSNALAIAGVTLTLRALLLNTLTDNAVASVLGSASVTAQAPSRVAVGATEANTLNLFLYNTSANAGWSNQYMPSRNGRGDRLTNQPLALNLHYAISAYGAADFAQDILLGYAVQTLHEIPVLSRDRIRAELQAAAASASQIMQAIADSELVEQLDTLKIAPVYMNNEDMSRVWGMFNAPYRPTATYLVTVLLLESRQPTRSTPPVLMRGTADRGVRAQPNLLSPFPTLLEVVPPDSQPSAELGDMITLRGYNLDGNNVSVIFEHPRLAAPFEIAPNTVTDSEVTVTLPNNAAAHDAWAAGMVAVSVEVERPTEIVRRTTNILAAAIAPRISVNAVRNGADVDFTIQVEPDVHPEQRISFAVGSREAIIDAPNAATDTLNVTITNLPAGTYITRLRVDGVDSQFINRTLEPPQFIASQQVNVP